MDRVAQAIGLVFILIAFLAFGAALWVPGPEQFPEVGALAMLAGFVFIELGS